MKKLEIQAAEYAEQYPENVRGIAFRAWLDGRKSADPSKETLEERKAKFAEKVKIFVPEYGIEMIRDFYEYWTETNERGNKMRFEKEKTFEVGKRLSRWRKNNFNRNGKISNNTAEAAGGAGQSIFGFANQVLQERERKLEEYQGCPNG